jgi:hypothetical protein
MKHSSAKITIALLLACFSFSSFAAGNAGSVEAAKDMVPTFLGKLYTIVETPVVQGDRATVKAKLLDLNCTLTLVRHATANSSGWVVEKHDCKK